MSRPGGRGGAASLDAERARLMPTLQLDLFTSSGYRPDQTSAPTAGRPSVIASELDDTSLITPRSAIAAALHRKPGGGSWWAL